MSSGNNSWLSVIFMIFSMAVMGAFWLVRNSLKACIWTASNISSFLASRNAGKMGIDAMKTVQASANATMPVESEFEPSVTVAVKPKQLEEFVAADRIVTIRLDPSVAVVHLRMYKSQGVVKREMIVTEPRLRGLLQGRRHTLADATYEPAVGLDVIKDETVCMVQELINLKGNTKVQLFKAPAEPKQAPKVEPKKPPPAAAPKEVLPANESKSPPKGQTYAPRVQTGVTFEGCLIEAGTRTMTPQGRDPYETFEAKLRLANGVDLPLRGLELDRELQAAGVKLGDSVAITPLGKVPVSLPSGEEGLKNMYRVVRTGDSR